MHAAGNHQWGSGYPNAEVFTQDIRLGQLWVAEIDGTVGGVAAVTLDAPSYFLNPDWTVDPTAAITTHRLAVDPDLGGRGIASRLMQKAEEIARERGVSLLRADTDPKNPVTNYLFPKLGYQFVGSFGIGFRPGMRFLCYEKRL